MGELDGVTHEVDQYLSQAVGIAAHHCRDVVGNAAYYFNGLFLKARTDDIAHIIGEQFDVKINVLEFDLPGLDF